MESVKINNKQFVINNISQKNNLLIISFLNSIDLSSEILTEIDLYTSGGLKCVSFDGYDTIYKINDNIYTLSNDGSVYKEPIDNTSPHDPTPEEVARQLENCKIANIKMSNNLLESYLFEHPLLFIDGLYYSVVKDKQNLLANRLISYQLELQSGINNPILNWNSTGEICVSWTYNNLVNLALSIKNYVEPLVKKQQEYEKQIGLCKTLQEINNLVISYEAD